MATAMTITRKNDLSTLMSRSWSLHKEFQSEMSACMRQAWELERLQEAIRATASFITIVYRKKDGSTRKALAAPLAGTGLNSTVGGRKPSPKVFTYFDIERNDWRCFRCENLIAWY